MAGRHLPDSLELLLDTMCNTFGGVMFITISMVLMVSAVSRMLSEASPQELDRQVLEEERRRIAALEQEIGRMETRLRLSDSHVVRDDANSREEADLLRKALREAAALESEAAGKQSHLEALEQEISRQRERNAAGAKQLQEEEQRDARRKPRHVERVGPHVAVLRLNLFYHPLHSQNILTRPLWHCQQPACIAYGYCKANRHPSLS